MFEEVNTRDNTPAQIDIFAGKGDHYDFLFMAKGGGSANKTYLYQQTPAVLRHDKLTAFLDEKIRTLGTAACPPYHLAIVVGGLSAEMNLKTVKLASARYLDALPTEGNNRGQAFRDLGLEAEIHKMTQHTGIGAQFGGKYFCHDVRVIRLPRHGASVPIGIGVSCSADRQAKAKITADGLFIEQLETDPAKYLPNLDHHLSEHVVSVDLNRPMSEILAELTQYPIKTRLSLSGTIVVARDLAHAAIQKQIEAGKPMPDYFKDHIVYYAGPAKTPEGYASGSFGPTTAGRMDSYVEPFQALGGSMVMLAKGNRSPAVTAPARSMAASISARSAAPPRSSPRTISARSRCWTSRISGWRRSGRSMSRTSRPSSWSTTRATTSSRESDGLADPITHTGGCHCGVVRFEVRSSNPSTIPAPAPAA